MVIKKINVLALFAVFISTVYFNIVYSQVCSGTLGSSVFLEDFGSGVALYGQALPPGVTNYIYQTGPPPNGTYVISSSSNPSGINLGYVSDGDHTGNLNGYMMVINSDYPASEVYRKHATGLCQNTTYVFSAFISNNNTPSTPTTVCPGYVYANVKFQIEYPVSVIQNSITTGPLPLGLSNTTLNWQQYGFTFTTLPGQTSVDIVLKNNAPGGCGNDYVVDDISLSPCGPGVALSIAPNATVFCAGESLILQSAFTSGGYTNPQYQWQFSNDGGGTWTDILGATSPNYNIASVASSQAGIYQLLIAETGNINLGSCRINAGPITFSVPTGVATNSLITICPSVSTTLTATGATTYTWSNGVVSNSIIVNPTVNTIYTVTANSIGGCVSIATVVVNINCTITQTVPTAFFTSPDTVCVNQSFSLSNLSTGATSNYWTFCQGNTNLAPQSVNLGNIGFFNGPVFITIAKEGSNYYAFVTNNTLGALTKLFFGSSLLNPPVATNLGNVSGAFPSSLEDLHIEYESGNWYGIAVGGLGGSESVVRINFGSSLANIPTAVNMGNIGSLSYPQRLKIFKNGANYFGFTTNRNNNTITRLNFGTSIANTPTGVNMGNIGTLNTPDAIAIVNVSSLWYGYIINEGNSTITRLDFGNSLLNTPTGTNLGNTGALNGPRGIDMWTECNEVRGLITNRNSNDLLNMKLSAGPTGPVVTTSFGNIANFSFPHSITRFRSGDTLFAFITNVSNNTLSRIYYPGCVNSSIASSTLTTPPTISYNAPGTYYINLVINEGQITQTNYCKQITVISTPTVVVSGANICAGSSASLTVSGANSYSWSSSPSLSGSTGSVVNTTPSISESYTVTGTIGTCTNTGVCSVTVIPNPTITIIPTLSSICSGQTTTLTASAANSYSWTNSATLSGSTGSVVIASPMVTTTYTVSGIVGSCVNSAMVTVSVVSQPVITINPSATSICLGASLTLTANGAPSYTWTPNVTATNTAANIVDASPNINTTYTVVGGVGTCTNTALVTINVIQNPPISVSDKTICARTTETLIATGAATYSWSPSLGLNAINGQTVTASPLSTQMYIVSGTFTNGCIGNASALVTVINNPTISVSASSLVICAGQSSGLTASGAPSYSWSPAMSLTNVNGSQTIATPLKTETYVVVGSNGVGPNFCSSTQTIEIKVLEKVIPSVSPSTSFCLGSSTIVYASGGTIYSWNPTINVINPNDSVTIVKPTISTIYTVTVSRNGLCPSTTSATVEVVVNPLPIVYAGNDTIVNIGEYITLQGTGNVDVGFLSPSTIPLNCNFCPTITVNPYNTTCYTLMGANQYYCYNFDEICVSVLKDWDVYIPNTFTPNDDLTNEYFIPLGYGIEKINLSIFDRWGLQLFKEENTTLGWDGKKNGKLCEQGIYVYQVEIFTLGGQKFSRTGHVNLLPRAN